MICVWIEQNGEWEGMDGIDLEKIYIHTHENHGTSVSKCEKRDHGATKWIWNIGISR